MKIKTNIWLPLTFTLTLVLSMWLVVVQAQGPSTQPPSNKTVASKNNSPWETWESLPLSLKIKVDPRLLAELRGEVIPTHLSNNQNHPDMAPSLSEDPPD